MPGLLRRRKLEASGLPQPADRKLAWLGFDRLRLSCNQAPTGFYRWSAAPLAPWSPSLAVLLNRPPARFSKK
jgi:hypothetical protein